MSPPPDTSGPAALDAELTRELPERLEIGGGTALLIEGRADPRLEPTTARIQVAGVDAAPDAIAMPPPGSLEPGDRWWVVLELPADTPLGVHEVRLSARLGGRTVTAALGTLELVLSDSALAPPAPSVISDADERPLICVCMATHEPDPDRLTAQIESIRAQDWPAWTLVISDDASGPERFAAIEALAREDSRIHVSRSPARLGFYRNFERALRLAPLESRWVALADQDDRWDADKLSALAAPLERAGVMLAYSDMRILDEHGELLSDTYWILRRNSWDDIASLLVANTVTGAASMFERELLDDALPFPPAIGDPYHDHWLALCALALGQIAYVDRPTYERVRHLESVTAGTRHAQALREMRNARAIGGDAAVPPRSAKRLSRRGLRARLGGRPGWRAVYFARWLQLSQFARIVLMRGGSRVAADKRRVLERAIGAERSATGATWLALRSLRPLFGRDETMARERVLLGGVLWRRVAGRRLPGRRHS